MCTHIMNNVHVYMYIYIYTHINNIYIYIYIYVHLARTRSRQIQPATDYQIQCEAYRQHPNEGFRKPNASSTLKIRRATNPGLNAHTVKRNCGEGQWMIETKCATDLGGINVRWIWEIQRGWLSHDGFASDYAIAAFARLLLNNSKGATPRLNISIYIYMYIYICNV